MSERRSALQRQIEAGGRDGACGGRQLRLSEVRDWHLAHLRAFPAGFDAVRDAVRTCGGADLPMQIHRGATHGDSRLYRLTPDQYWWVSGGEDPLPRLARLLPPSAGTLTMLSAARVRIRLAGPPVRQLLAKGIALDLHPEVFQIGQSAQTGLHHTGVFLERLEADCYELYVQRSYAAAVWEWLVDAALPFGYDVGREERAANRTRGSGRS